MSCLPLVRTVFTAALTLGLAPIGIAFGADSGGGGSGSNAGSSSPPAATQTTTTCTNGKIWSAQRQMCLTADQIKATSKKNGSQKKSELKPDDILYEAAREFAYAGQYGNALNALRAAENQNDPRILNYLGFTNRKLGRIDLAMTYYRKAIAIDENYILARSYMGQGLIEQGDIQAARVQLVEIRDRGGENTWAYRSLLQSLGGDRTTY